VKQLVVVLDLPTTFDSTTEAPMSLSQADSTYFITHIDVQDPELFHCRVVTALVTYRDQVWYAPQGKSLVHSCQPVDSPLGPCALFTDNSDHVISSLLAGRDMPIDSVSTITTQGTADGLQSYVTPSQSGIRMRSATVQVVSPADECALPFPVNYGQASLSVMCQHTPDMSSSIFSPAETCDTLDYDAYALTCNRRESTYMVRFTKSDSPGIVLRGTYKLRTPYIHLPPSVDAVQSVVPMTYQSPSIHEELLSANNADAIHQVLCLAHSSARHFDPPPEACRAAVLLLFCDRLSNDWFHGRLPVVCLGRGKAHSVAHANMSPKSQPTCAFFQDQQGRSQDQAPPAN
jgi:hypothetical protein